MPTNSKHAETIVLHTGYRSDPATTAVAVPIYQTTSYQFHDTGHAARLFALQELGNIYTRIMNPTAAVLEERVAALEGGVAGLALASGQAASLFAVQNITHAGDNFVASTDLYGGTWNLFQNTMSTMGIAVRFVDPADPENFRRATDARTRCYYAETLPNPKLEVFPIAEVAEIGRELGVPLIMDNTAAPVLCQPIEHGAAIVTALDNEIYRRTWHLDRRRAGRWREFRLGKARRPVPNAEPARSELSRCSVDPGGEAARPDRLHHQGAGHAAARCRRGHEPVQRLHVHPGVGDPAPAHARALRQRRQGGASISPSHPKVTRVIYPGLMTGEPRRRADAYLTGGYGGLVGFELAGGRAAGEQLH